PRPQHRAEGLPREEALVGLGAPVPKRGAGVLPRDRLRDDEHLPRHARLAVARPARARAAVAGALAAPRSRRRGPDGEAPGTWSGRLMFLENVSRIGPW